MVMGFVGADVDELEMLATGLAQVAERLRTSRAGVRRVAHTSAWTGDDAERFRVDFDRRVGPSIEMVADLLDQTATIVRQNAEDQCHASGDRAVVDSRSTVGAIRFAFESRRYPDFMEGFVLEALDKGLLVGELTGATDTLPTIGTFADLLQISYYTDQYGFWSYENKTAMLDALGGTIAARWGPLGSVGWSFASDGAESLGESIGSAYFERHHGMTRAELEGLANSGDVRAQSLLSEGSKRSSWSSTGDWVWSLWN